MTGPAKAALAFACLLGLAACGGGGGSAGGGPGGGDPGGGGPGGGDPGGGGPTAYLFEETAAGVTALNTLIAGYTPNIERSAIAVSRVISDNTSYQFRILPTGVQPTDDPPDIRVGQGSDQSSYVALRRNELGGNGYRFDQEAYTEGSTEYEGRIYLWWDPDPAGPAGSYSYWGLWLRRPTAGGAWNEVNSFNSFTDASDDTSQYGYNFLDKIEGTAAYTGGANGIYTKDGDSAGLFAADVSLTVNYGGTVEGGAANWTMTGTIGNFVLSGNQDNEWSVTLNGAPTSTDDTTGTPTDNYFAGTANGGGAEGAFHVTFWGRYATDVPRWIPGKFKANFTDGWALGLFTAERDTSN